VRYLVLSHYHAVRVLGASAFGAAEIITHDQTRALIAERGKQDWDSEYGRMPRLFEEPSSIPGLTWPTLTFTAPATWSSPRPPCTPATRSTTTGHRPLWTMWPHSGPQR
jgi:hypothetical protein